MNRRALLLVSLTALAAIPASVWTQGAQYPVEVIKPGTRAYTFPPGYQTPWDKIQIRVTAKMSPNHFVLHGSEGLDPAHPDASGGRDMAPFGPAGVLRADTHTRQPPAKKLQAIQSHTNWPITVA